MTPMTRIFVFSITCIIAMAFSLSLPGVNGVGRRSSIVSLMWLVWVSGFAGLICYSILKRVYTLQSKSNALVAESVWETCVMCVVVLFATVSGSTLWTYEIAHYALGFSLPVCLILGSVDLWVRRGEIRDELE